jgi:hypothetical protein
MACSADEGMLGADPYSSRNGRSTNARRGAPSGEDPSGEEGEVPEGTPAEGSTAGGTGGGGGSTTGGATEGGTTGGATGAAAADVEVQVDNATATLDLNASREIQVTVTGRNYQGPVTLTMGTLPAGVTGEFAQATIDVREGAPATTRLTLRTATDAQPGAAPVEVRAAAGAQNKATTVNLTVQSRLLIDIPVNADANQGTAANPRTDAFGPFPIRIRAPANIGAQNPVAITFRNLDSTPHQIHASNDASGFPHGTRNIAQGQNEGVRNVTRTGTYNFYLHDQGTPNTVGRIIIAP